MKLTVIAAAALALALPLTSYAKATASASFSNFSVEIIDLNLNDGIDAALTLGDTGIFLSAGYYPSLDSLPEYFEYSLNDGAVDVGDPHGTSTATIANGDANLFSNFHGTVGKVASSAILSHQYSLTPYTRLVVRGDASVSSTSDGSRFGFSLARLFLTYEEPGGGKTIWYDPIVSSSGIGDESSALSLSIRSYWSPYSGTMGMNADTFATIASPVPEPSQYAMFSLGLAGLCWRLRRSASRK